MKTLLEGYVDALTHIDAQLTAAEPKVESRRPRPDTTPAMRIQQELEAMNQALLDAEVAAARAAKRLSEVTRERYPAPFCRVRFAA